MRNDPFKIKDTLNELSHKIFLQAYIFSNIIKKEINHNIQYVYSSI